MNQRIMNFAYSLYACFGGLSFPFFVVSDPFSAAAPLLFQGITLPSVTTLLHYLNAKKNSDLLP